jgi:predicted nucleic-acid-binding Zn-ribbon protein
MENVENSGSEDECPRCGGPQIVMRPWALNNRATQGSMRMGLATLDKSPSIWNGRIESVALVARVCTQCGYAEFFVENTDQLNDPQSM